MTDYRTQIDNLDLATLTDRYADLKDAINHLEDQLKVVRARMAELAPGREVYRGSEAEVHVVLSERGTLDRTAVVAELGREWVKAHTTVALVEQWRMKRIKAVSVRIAA